MFLLYTQNVSLFSNVSRVSNVQSVLLEHFQTPDSKLFNHFKRWVSNFQSFKLSNCSNFSNFQTFSVSDFQTCNVFKRFKFFKRSRFLIIQVSNSRFKTFQTLKLWVSNCQGFKLSFVCCLFK